MEGKEVQSSDIFVPTIRGIRPFTIHLTFSAGHWTMYGSVHLRFENFSVEHEGKRFEVDFSIHKILWPVKSLAGITSEYLHLNGISPIHPNPDVFERWVLSQILLSWNDP